jgi:hypothetical protein
MSAKHDPIEEPEADDRAVEANPAESVAETVAESVAESVAETVAADGPESDGVWVEHPGEGVEPPVVEVDVPAEAADQEPPAPDSQGAADAALTLDHVFIDLGRQKKKLIRKLKDFRGPLMDEVEVAIQDLQAEGHLDPKVQTVVVLVRGK